MILWERLLNQGQIFLLIFARVAALLRVAPLSSSSAIPPLGRGALAFFASIVFFGMAVPLYDAVPQSGLGYAAAVVGEILLGIIMGLFLQIIFAIFQTAGQLFSFQMGFGASQVYDPLAQIEIPLIGQFLNLVGLAVFLSASGMQRLFLLGLGGSFRVMRGMDLLAGDSFLQDFFVGALGGLFRQSLILAFPIMGTLVLISVTMGLLAKAAPQMNVLIIGFPLKIMLGFIFIGVLFTLLAATMERYTSKIGLEFNQMFHLMAP